MFAIAAVAIVGAIVLVAWKVLRTKPGERAGYPAYDDGLRQRDARRAETETTAMDGALLDALIRGNEIAHRGMADAAADGRAIPSPIDRARAASDGRLRDEGVTAPPVVPEPRPAFDTDEYRISTADRH